MRSGYLTESDLDVEPVAVLYCILTDKLPSVVSDDYARDAVSCDNISPYELTDLLVCDQAEGLGFHILGKVIYSHDDELSLSLGRWEGAKEIHTPLVEG